MKILVIISNLLLLVLLYLIISEEGIPSPEDGYFFFFLILLINPFLNLYYLYKNSHEEGFFSVFIKRKILEEKKKIEKLNKEE